jgi:hypothetical protein
MHDQELLAKQKKMPALGVAFVITLIPITFVSALGRNLFVWKRFYPDVANTIAFVVFTILCLLAWLNYIDDRPRLQLDKDGIRRRKNFLISTFTIISWSDINYFYISKDTYRGLLTVTLIVGVKDSDKDIRILLTNLDLPAEAIIDLVESYSLSYGFQHLENETS